MDGCPGCGSDNWTLHCSAFRCTWLTCLTCEEIWETYDRSTHCNLDIPREAHD